MFLASFCNKGYNNLSKGKKLCSFKCQSKEICSSLLKVKCHQRPNTQKYTCLTAASVVGVEDARLLLVRWRPAICMKIHALEVICRVTVMVV